MSKRFAVVDIETTGALVRRDRITEIGIVITDGTQILDKYSSLVNPGISIPAFITKITGITDDMVADAPPFYQIARKIVEMTEGAIFVAHNVRFDYGFLRAMFEELGYAYNKKRLCTVQLAKRTLDIPKYNLDSLINYFGIDIAHRHRALDDAYATAIVLQHLLKKDDHGIQVEDQINRGVRESLLPAGITIEHLHALPETPGIYYFLDKQRDIVYVGKSKNIQKRVMSHFTKTSRKAEKLQSQTAHIDFLETGTDLIAQIVESVEIKRHWPPMNRAQRSNSFHHMLITRKNALGYLRFDLTTRPKKDDEILNAYPTKRSGISMLTYLTHEFGLCPLYTQLEKGMGPCSMRQYEKCYGACTHDEPAEDYNQRAESAREFANNIFERNFVIIDHGRKGGERSLVAVVNGKYIGHGYIDDQESVSGPHDLLHHIVSYPYYPEINAMIRRYIDQGGGEKIIYFDEAF